MNENWYKILMELEMIEERINELEKEEEIENK